MDLKGSNTISQICRQFPDNVKYENCTKNDRRILKRREGGEEKMTETVS
jgi:hypothetical protein